MAQRSWEAVAHRLASRLMYHAYCEEGHEYLSEDCPFCDDIAAYREYVAKCQAANRMPMQTSSLNNVPMITLDEVLRGKD